MLPEKFTFNYNTKKNKYKPFNIITHTLKNNIYSIPSNVVSSKLKKYELALSTLSSESLTVILDCDIFITNPSIPIQRIWDEYAHTETEVLLSRDAHWRMGVPVNSGVVILKGGEFSRTLLR